MNDDQILMRGGDEEDIKVYAEEHGANSCYTYEEDIIDRVKDFATENELNNRGIGQDGYVSLSELISFLSTL